jgi:hypothetical protein
VQSLISASSDSDKSILGRPEVTKMISKDVLEDFRQGSNEYVHDSRL